MRSWVIVCCVLIVALVFGAVDADAKRRRRSRRSKKRAGPPVVVVVPFEGMGKQGPKLGRSLSLELELVDGIKMSSGKALKRDLKRKKKRAFERKTLQRIMTKRKVDVVLRGVAGWTKEGDEVVWLVGYTADGRPRFFEPFVKSPDNDAMAQAMAVAIGEGLKKLTKKKVVKVVFPKKPTPKKEMTEADLFVDEKKVDDEKKASKAGKGDKPKRVVGGERDDGKKLVGDSPDNEASGSGTPKKLDLGDEDNNREQRLAAVDEEREDDDGADEPDLSHLIAVSGGFGSGAWLRQFGGANPRDDEPVFYFFTGGAHLRVSFWPIEWVGADVDAGAHVARLAHNVVGLTPEGSLLAVRPQASAALKARYILHLGDFGVGGGVRLTGRYLGQLVEEQRLDDGDLFTLFPTYHFYGVGLGAELFFSMVLFGNRFEMEPRLDLIPAAQMLEYPDWPGESSVTAAVHAQNIIRAELLFGVFAEVTTWATGLGTNWFGGPGTRRGRLLDPNTGQRAYVTGGLAINVDTGAQIGLGWMW